VVWTARGPLYAEAIGQQGDFLFQPWDLRDPQRQVLYAFIYPLLQGSTDWGVYLPTFIPMQGQVQFQGFTPLPSPVLQVSTLTQRPDLLLADHYCRQGLPVVELHLDRRAAVRLGHFDPQTVLVWPGVVWYPDWIGCWVYPPPVEGSGHPFQELPFDLG